MHLGPTTQPYPTQAPNIGSYVGKIFGGISDLPGVPTPIRFAGGLVEDLIASGALNPRVLTTTNPYPQGSMPNPIMNPYIRGNI